MATTAKQWKGKANQAVDLQLPSGNTARVKNPGMQAFIQAGIVPNELMGIILAAIEDQQMPKIDEMTEDPEKLVQILTLVDNITVFCVVEPPVESAPAEGVTRDADLLYVDEVDINDKMFIFQYSVGGTKDLETFRKEQAAAVVDLPAVPPVARPAKSTRGAPRKRSR